MKMEGKLELGENKGYFCAMRVIFYAFEGYGLLYKYKCNFNHLNQITIVEVGSFPFENLNRFSKAFTNI